MSPEVPWTSRFGKENKSALARRFHEVPRAGRSVALRWPSVDRMSTRPRRLWGHRALMIWPGLGIRLVARLLHGSELHCPQSSK